MLSDASQRLGRAFACGAISLLLAASGAVPAASAADDEAGQHWKRLWHPTFEPGLGAGIELQHVQWLGDRFAITGGDAHGAVVWWSEDGVEWTRTPRSAATQGGTALSIHGEPGAYVMLGERDPFTSRILHSADGLEWEPIDGEIGGRIRSLVELGGGKYVAYGFDGREGDCWMATSSDGGATWEPRWEGDWDTGMEGQCVRLAIADQDGFVGMIADGISVSEDGVTWAQATKPREIRASFDVRWRDVHEGDLAPLDEDTYVVAGHDTKTLTWSRDGGLALVEDLIDWSEKNKADIARGDERAVALRPKSPVPLISPPAGVYGERFERQKPVCRPRQPTLAAIVAMSPRERLDCYGRRDLTFKAWTHPFAEYGGTCPFGKPYDRLVCWETLITTGLGAGAEPFGHGFAPKARTDPAIERGSHVRVTGHFDDPAAARCPQPGWDGISPDGYGRRTKAQFVNECRRQFVVTRMRLIDDGEGPDT